MPDLCLFHAPGACSRVVMNALEEAGLDYTDRPINIFAGEQRSAEFRAVNPKGKVPALKVGEEVLTENPAILFYLAELRPEAGLLPVRPDPLQRARDRSGLIWCSNTLHPLARVMAFPGRTAPDDPDGAKAAAAGQLAEFASLIQARLDAGWWLGESWSITDTYLAWCLGMAQAAGLDLSAHDNILAHQARVRARPSYQRALARERAALESAGIQLPPGMKL